MGVKENTTRITLQFNKYDFRHNKVVAILRERPRSMSELVVNAILHYISCPEAGNELSKGMIRELVREALRDMAADGSLSGVSLAADTSSSDGSGVSAEDANSIGSMMDAFR